jgi:hypothetical protein
MKKKELIETINQINAQITKLVEPSIKQIIAESLKKEPTVITKKEDVTGAVGFYMIFSNVSDADSKCSCAIKHEDKRFTCVYRGHSYHMKNRLLSHLFYEPNSQYPNCMKIKIEGKKYNINLETQKLYFEEKEISEEPFPDDRKWLIITIPLTGSKQAIREMFEIVFDQTYGKPIYSDK